MVDGLKSRYMVVYKTKDKEERKLGDDEDWIFDRRLDSIVRIRNMHANA